jgi:hypothetical protein
MKRLVPILLLLLVVTGCRARLNSESTAKVELLDKHMTTVDPISREQKINVKVMATTGQFNAFLFLEKDQGAIVTDAEPKKDSPKIMDKALGATTASMSAQIPANERAVVLVMSGDGKPAQVTIKITN